MIKFLRLIPIRYRYFVLEYGALCVAAVLFLAAALGVFIYVQPNPIVSATYQTGTVLGTMDRSDEDRGFQVVATVRLKDGTITRVSAYSIVHAQWLLKPVCVARNTHENGRVRHPLAKPEKCDELSVSDQ